MTTTPTQAAATNAEIAQLLGLTHSGVSRIRAGHRCPSFPTMARIAEEFDWPIEAQVVAAIRASAPGSPSYADLFEQRLVEFYGARESDTADV